MRPWRYPCWTRWCLPRRRKRRRRRRRSRDFLGGSYATARPRAIGSLKPPAPCPDELPFIWNSLEPYKDQTTIVTGLHATSAEPPPGETGADHWVAAAFLCADKPKKTAGADVRAGHTIDQMIAEKYGQSTLLPSIEMNVEDPGSGSSNCGEGYSCVYTNTIAWASPTTPLPMELNPQVVFERMFGNGSSPEERAARRERSRSILDSLTPKISSLRGDFSVPDRARIDDYTDNVREIERRLEIAANASAAAPENLDVPPGIPQSFDEHIKLQFDLLALAFQADISRVGTLLFARDLTGRRYPASDAPGLGFHGGSHHGEDPARIDQFSKINEYHARMLAHLVEKTGEYRRWRRHVARSFVASVRQQHGKSEPAPSLRCAACPRRWVERTHGRRAPSGVPEQDPIDLEICC